MLTPPMLSPSGGCIVRCPAPISRQGTCIFTDRRRRNGRPAIGWSTASSHVAAPLAAPAHRCHDCTCTNEPRPVEAPEGCGSPYGLLARALLMRTPQRPGPEPRRRRPRGGHEPRNSFRPTASHRKHHADPVRLRLFNLPSDPRSDGPRSRRIRTASRGVECPAAYDERDLRVRENRGVLDRPARGYRRPAPLEHAERGRVPAPAHEKPEFLPKTLQILLRRPNGEDRESSQVDGRERGNPSLRWPGVRRQDRGGDPTCRVPPRRAGCHGTSIQGRERDRHGALQEDLRVLPRREARDRQVHGHELPADGEYLRRPAPLRPGVRIDRCPHDSPPLRRRSDGSTG